MSQRRDELNLEQKTAIANRFFECTPNYAKGELPINSNTIKCLRTCLDIYLKNVEANQFHDHWEYFNRLCHTILNLHETGEKLPKIDLLDTIGICCKVMNDDEVMFQDIGDSLVKILAILVEDLKDTKWDTLNKEDLLTLMSHYSTIKLSPKNFELGSNIGEHIVDILDTYGEELMESFDVIDYFRLTSAFCLIIINQTNDEIIRNFCIRLVCTLKSLRKDEENLGGNKKPFLSAVLARLRGLHSKELVEDHLTMHLSQILRKIHFAHRYHTQLWIMEVVFTLTQSFTVAPAKAYKSMMEEHAKKNIHGVRFNSDNLYDLRVKFLEIKHSSAFESIESLHDNFDKFLLFLNNKTRKKTQIFTVAGKVVKIDNTTVNEDCGFDVMEFNSLAGCVSFTVGMEGMLQAFGSEFADGEGEAYFEAFYENFETLEKDDDTLEMTFNIRRLMYKQGLKNGNMTEILNIKKMMIIICDAQEEAEATGLPKLEIEESKKFIADLQKKMSRTPINLNATITNIRAENSTTSIVSEMYTPSVQIKRKRQKRDLSAAKRSINFNAFEETPENVPKKSKKMDTIQDDSFEGKEGKENVPKNSKKMDTIQDDSFEGKEGKENVSKTKKRGSKSAFDIFDEHKTPKGVLSPAQKKLKGSGNFEKSESPAENVLKKKRRSSAANKSKDSLIDAEGDTSMVENLDKSKMPLTAARRSERISSAANKSREDSIKEKLNASSVSNKSGSSKNAAGSSLELMEANTIEDEPKRGRKRRPTIVWTPQGPDYDPNAPKYVPEYPPVEFVKMTAEIMAKKTSRPLTDEECERFGYNEKPKEVKPPVKAPKDTRLKLLTGEKVEFVTWWELALQKQKKNETPPFLDARPNPKPENIIREMVEQHAKDEKNRREYKEYYENKAKNQKEKEIELKRQLAMLKEEQRIENEKKKKKTQKQAKDSQSTDDKDYQPYDKNGIKGRVWKPDALENDDIMSYESFIDSIEAPNASNKKVKCYDQPDDSNASVKKSPEDVFKLEDEDDEMVQPNFSESKVKQEPNESKKAKKVKKVVKELQRHFPGLKRDFRKPEVTEPVPHLVPDYIIERNKQTPVKTEQPPKHPVRRKIKSSKAKKSINFDEADVTVVSAPAKEEILRRKEEEEQKKDEEEENARLQLVEQLKNENKIIPALGIPIWLDRISGEEIPELSKKPPRKKRVNFKEEPRVAVSVNRLRTPARPRLPRACKEAAKDRLLSCDLSPIREEGSDESDPNETLLASPKPKRKNFKDGELENNDMSDEDEKFVTANDDLHRKSSSLEPENDDINDITDVNEQYVTAFDIVPRNSNSFEEKDDDQYSFGNESLETVIEKPVKSPAKSSTKRKSDNFAEEHGSPKKQKVDADEQPLNEEIAVVVDEELIPVATWSPNEIQEYVNKGTHILCLVKKDKFKI